MSDINIKECFFISPIGHPNSEVRAHSDQVLRHIVRKAVAPLGYKVERADEIGKPGEITVQVLDKVINSSLVVADLTGHNPNVFYELGVRHAFRKPFVQIVQTGEQLPFDVANTRTVYYDLHDLDVAEEAIEQISKQVEHLEKSPTDIVTPLSVSMGLQELISMADPASGILAEILSKVEAVSSASVQTRNRLRLILQALDVDPKGIGEPLPPALYREVRRNGEDIAALTEEIRELRKGSGDNKRDGYTTRGGYDDRRALGGYGENVYNAGDPMEMDVDDLPF